uniref:Uncharacterized protein n=1 Tax=Arundo donax TaxID=35708 RepID=A0A0A8YJH8_ARUDO
MSRCTVFVTPQLSYVSSQTKLRSVFSR